MPHYYLQFADPRLADRITSILFESDWQHASKADANIGAVDLFLCDDTLEQQSPSLAPRLALTDHPDACSGFDEAIAGDGSDHEILAQIDRWRPTPDAQRFAEVAHAFGNEAVSPIVRGLREQLLQAIAALDAGSFATAHRIAGLAGTLGFKRTSMAWLTIDEGDLSDTVSARREARLAVAAIERWLAATGFARDSAA